MSNQILISSGAKLRDLDDVIIGTDGVLTSLGFNVANGVPKLDENGKILVSQLPNSVMEFKGVWNAATNTPTLANGTGNAGDVYLCNVAGTVNFGAGPIAFAVGDYAVYTGTVWARSSGATGTVTSVGLSRSGDALTVTGSPITTSGTINIGFAGTNTQYINGAGNLVTFPTIAQEAQRLITEVYNETGATLTKGTVVYINGGHGNLPTITKAIATGDATSAQTYGIVQNDIGNNNNGFVVVIGSLMDLDTQAYPDGTQLYLSSTTAGAYTSVKQYAPAHLVYVGIVTRSHPTQGVIEVRIQNGFEMDELHNVAAQNPDNNDILQYKTATTLWTKVAGTTSNIAEGSNLYFTNARARQSISLTTTGSTGASTYDNVTGVLNIPNYVDQYVGTVTSVGLSAPTGFSVTGSPVTSSGTLALAFAAGYSLPTNASQANWDTAYTNRITSLTTTGSSGAATLISNTLNVPTYTLAGLGGVPTTRTLTINGLTQDLSADRTWTITAGISSVSGTAPISVSTVSGAATVSIATANTTTTGALTSADWNTFNGKQAGSTNLTSLSGLTFASTSFVKMTAAGTFSLDTNTYALASALGNYLPLAGGTLTGPLGGTSATFSSSVSIPSAAGLILGTTAVTDGIISSVSSTVGLRLRINTADALVFSSTKDATFTGNVLIEKTQPDLILNSTSSTEYSRLVFKENGGTEKGVIEYINSAFTTVFRRNKLELVNDEGITFITESNFTSPELFITSTGNVLLKKTTDTNIRLQVAESTGVNNWISATFAGKGNTDVVVIGNLAGPTIGGHNAALGAWATLAINPDGGNVMVGTRVDAGFTLNVNGTGRFTSSVSMGAATITSGGGHLTLIRSGFNTFGIGTGIASGISGLVISDNTSGTNPFIIAQVTGAATFASSVTARGNISVSNNGAQDALLSATATFADGYDAILQLNNTHVGGQNWTIRSTNNSQGNFGGGKLVFSNQSISAGSNAMVITSANYVGIGTISPNVPLRVANTSSWISGSFGGAGGTNQVVIGNYNGVASIGGHSTGHNAWTALALNFDGGLPVYVGTTTGVSGGGQLQVNGNVNINGVFQINGTTIGGGGGSGVTGSGTTNYVTKWTGGTTLGNSGIFDAGGIIGIGTASPAITSGATTGLNVVSNSYIQMRITSTVSSAGIEFFPLSGDRWEVQAGSDSKWFVYNRNNAVYNLLIHSSGNVVIGGALDNGYKLQITGSASFAFGFLSVFRGSSSPNDILVGNTGSVFYIGGNTQVAGSVSASGGFFDTSDARLKTLVEDNYLLSSIANVKAKLYIKGGRKELGYYAQDLENILPSAVKEGSDGFLSLSYAQVHTAKLAVIEDEVTILKNRVSELETKLQKYDA